MFALIRNVIAGKGSKDRNNAKDQVRESQVAAGVLLLEAAHVDNQCTEEELTCIVATLRDKFALPDNHVDELIQLAQAHREQSVDLWHFSNQINRHFSASEKLAVMEDVWRIILLDGQLEQHEDQYAHKLANLLRLSHDQMIDAKLKAREQVAGLNN